MSLLPSRNIAAALLLLCAVAAMAPGIEPSAPPLGLKTPTQSSTSATGQFTIHGMDLATRGAFCLMCDDVAAALGRLLRDDAHFALPVVVVLKPPGDSSSIGPAVTWNISQLTHGGFHLQVNATLRSDFRGDDFAREVVRVLLAERILRNQKELKTSRQNVLPNWVLTGIANAMEFRGRSRPSLLFAAVFRSGQIYSVDKILSADPARLDALARGVYETSACALVLALLDQPEGPLRFAKFLDSLARNDKSDRDLLRQLFPSMGASKNSLEKWWSLQMAALATPSPLESLGSDETEARLRDALTLVLDPLPEKEKKKKAKPETPVKETESQPGTEEVKKEEKRRFLFFGRPTSSADVPAMGGKKILFVPVSDADTDGSCADTEKKSADAPAPAGKPVAANAADKESAAKSKAAAKEATKKPEANPEAAKDEKSESEKRSMLNPRNWFRKKDKPAEDATKKEMETPKKEVASPKEKESPPAAKKTQTREATPPAPAPRKEAPPAPPNPRETRPQGIPIEEFATVWKRDDRDKIFQQSITRLNALRVQAHPLYRPLIGDYISTIRLLVNGKQKGVAEKLASLREQRSNISQLARAVESHLDWYEASQTRSYSGAFDDYLKLCDQIDRESRSRNDALSKYLDLLQKEYN